MDVLRRGDNKGRVQDEMLEDVSPLALFDRSLCSIDAR